MSSDLTFELDGTQFEVEETETELELEEVEFGSQISFAELDVGKQFVRVLLDGRIETTVFKKISPSIDMATSNLINILLAKTGRIIRGQFLRDDELIVEIISMEDE